ALNVTADLLTQIAADKTGPGAGAINRLAQLLTDLAKAAPASRDQVQKAFVVPLSVALGQITNSLRAQPLTLETLPQDLVMSWETSDGHFRVQAAPRGDPNDNETLRKFATAVLAAEPTAINGPI